MGRRHAALGHLDDIVAPLGRAKKNDSKQAVYRDSDGVREYARSVRDVGWFVRDSIKSKAPPCSSHDL